MELNLAKEDLAVALVRSGKLSVSRTGKVFNHDTQRYIGYKSGGYLMISVNESDGTIYKVLIHRLMWRVYKGEIPETMQLNHKDGNKSHCVFKNLELVTASGNTQHAVDTGLLPVKLGEQRSNAAFTDKQVAKLRKRFATENLSYHKGAEKFNVHPLTFAGMLKGSSYSHIVTGYEDACRAKLDNLRLAIDVDLIKALRRENKSSYQIADETGYSRNTVMKYW